MRRDELDSGGLTVTPDPVSHGEMWIVIEDDRVLNTYQCQDAVRDVAPHFYQFKTHFSRFEVSNTRRFPPFSDTRLPPGIFLSLCPRCHKLQPRLITWSLELRHPMSTSHGTVTTRQRGCYYTTNMFWLRSESAAYHPERACGKTMVISCLNRCNDTVFSVQILSGSLWEERPNTAPPPDSRTRWTLTPPDSLPAPIRPGTSL